MRRQSADGGSVGSRVMAGLLCSDFGRNLPLTAPTDTMVQDWDQDHLLGLLVPQPHSWKWGMGSSERDGEWW